MFFVCFSRGDRNEITQSYHEKRQAFEKIKREVNQINNFLRVQTLLLHVKNYIMFLNLTERAGNECTQRHCFRLLLILLSAESRQRGSLFKLNGCPCINITIKLYENAGS